MRLVTSGKPDEAGAHRRCARNRAQARLEDLLARSGRRRRAAAARYIGKHQCRRRPRFRFRRPSATRTAIGKWAGYKHPVALPVTFTLADSKGAGRLSTPISFSAFARRSASRCRQGLTVDPGADPDNAEDAALVTAALAALPAPQRPDFGVNCSAAATMRLVVEASFPGSPEAADFFIAGERDYMFGAPARGEKDGKLVSRCRSSTGRRRRRRTAGCTIR